MHFTSVSTLQKPLATRGDFFQFFSRRPDRKLQGRGYKAIVAESRGKHSEECPSQIHLKQPTRRSVVQITALCVLESAWELCSGLDQANAAKQPALKQPGLKSTKQPVVNAAPQPVISTPKQPDFSVAIQPGNQASWGYDYQNGPPTWGGTCSSGNKQSPINLASGEFLDTSSKQNANLKVVIDYQVEKNASILNSGHGTMQVNFPPGQKSLIGEREIELIQLHFHSPSEHSVNGVRAPLEVHLVHKDKTGKLVVLGVLMTRSRVSNPILQIALDKAPSKEVQTPIPLGAPIDLFQLLPTPNIEQYRPVVHYMGSLTTPPCTEEVDWFVFLDPVAVSTDQIVDFEAFLGNGTSYGQNARPIQNSGGRNLEFMRM